MAGIRKLLQIQKRLMPLLSRSDLAQSGSTAQEYSVVRSSTPNALTDVTGIPISALPGAENPDDSDVLAGVQENETKQFRLSTLLEWIKGEIRPNDIGAQIKIIASGILKGDGQGGVTAATPGTDYGTYSKPNGGIPASDLASGVVPSASSATPQNLGTAAAGSSTDYSRADHVHNKPAAADIGAQSTITASGILKGDGQGGVSAATPGTDYGTYSKPSGGIPANDIAPGVIPAVPNAYTPNPAMDGTASPGSSADYARGDHVHPTDTSRAPAGYGLGVKLGTLTPIADADDTTLMTGWYATSATPTDTQNLPSGLSGDDKVGALYVAARGEYVYQEFYCNRRNRVYSRLRGWSGSGYAWTAWQVEASIDPANPFATEQQLAYVETGSTASRAYAVGEYFCWNGLLYRVTAAISSGAAFTAGTNCVAQTVGDALTGKAPAGYGLGVMTRDIGTSVTDCNNIDVTGWFDVAAGASNRPSGLSQYYQAVIYSVVRGPIYSYQEYYDYNTGKVYRRFKNTTWSSWVQI